jgi:hypothetical protein
MWYRIVEHAWHGSGSVKCAALGLPVFYMFIGIGYIRPKQTFDTLTAGSIHSAVKGDLLRGADAVQASSAATGAHGWPLLAGLSHLVAV